MISLFPNKTSVFLSPVCEEKPPESHVGLVLLFKVLHKFFRLVSSLSPPLCGGADALWWREFIRVMGGHVRLRLRKW